MSFLMHGLFIVSDKGVTNIQFTPYLIGLIQSAQEKFDEHISRNQQLALSISYA